MSGSESFKPQPTKDQHVGVSSFEGTLLFVVVTESQRPPPILAVP